MTPEELATIRAGAETALDAVHRGWPWPEIDNDLVIGAALKDVFTLVAEVERLHGALQEIARAARWSDDAPGTLSTRWVQARVWEALGISPEPEAVPCSDL